MAPGAYNNGDRFYIRLEVAPTASQDEIARAYRRLAHGAHPDANPEDPDAARRFREVTEAYEVLGDPARRARYDATGPSGGNVAEHPSSTHKVAEAPGAAGTGTPGPASPAAPPSAGPGPPVFIGERYPRVPPGQFRAGAVPVEVPRQEEASGAGQGDLARRVARLLSELLAPWWRC